MKKVIVAICLLIAVALIMGCTSSEPTDTGPVKIGNTSGTGTGGTSGTSGGTGEFACQISAPYKAYFRTAGYELSGVAWAMGAIGDVTGLDIEDDTVTIFSVLDIAPEGFEETIVQLEEIKETLEDENASRDEIIEALQDIRDTIIPQIKERTQLRAANALDNKLEAVMNRSGNTVEKMNALVANLQEKGVDTEDLEAAIVEFESDMADAEAKHAEAKAKWAEAETAEDKQAVLKEGFVMAKEVNRILIEGHQNLKQALVQVREQARTATQTSTGSDDSEDTDEAEDDADANASDDSEDTGDSNTE